MVKKAAGALAGIMLITGMTACGGGGAADTGKQQATASNEPVEIAIYENSTDYTTEKFMDLYGNLIRKKYPHMSFKLYSLGKGTSLPELITQGVSLDLIKVSSTSVYDLLIQNGLQQDISDLIKKYKYDLNQLDPVVLEFMKQIGNGEIYGLPNGVASVALFYNKDLFDKFGVAYPKDGMNWDETYELAKKLTRSESGIQYRGFAELFNYIGPYNQLSQGYIDTKTNKATFNNDNWKTLINNFARFHQLPGNEYDPGALDGFFKKGTVAMLASLSGGDYTAFTESPFNLDIASLPTFKDRPDIGPAALIPFYAISKTSKNREQAFLAISEIASESFQKEFALKGFASPLKSKALRESLGKGVPQLKDKNIKAVVPEKFAPLYAMNKYHSVTVSSMNTAYTEVAQGKKTVNEALRDAEEAANKKIQELIASGK